MTKQTISVNLSRTSFEYKGKTYYNYRVSDGKNYQDVLPRVKKDNYEAWKLAQLILEDMFKGAEIEYIEDKSSGKD